MPERYEPELIHTTRPGERVPRCGTADRLPTIVLWENVTDPDHPAVFTCGGCWKDAAGGVEPMGGSLYLAAAHGAGAEAPDA